MSEYDEQYGGIPYSPPSTPSYSTAGASTRGDTGYAQDPNADAVLENRRRWENVPQIYQDQGVTPDQWEMIQGNQLWSPGSQFHGATVGTQMGENTFFAGYEGPNEYVRSGQYAKDVAAGARERERQDAARRSRTTTGGTRTTTGGATAGGGGSRSISLGYRGPVMDKPVFEGPDPYKSPEYKPPEYDADLERKLRQQYQAPGLSQIRRASQAATIASKSIDNPASRGYFINQAIEGAGAALSKVAGTAGREATGEARARYSQELDKYNKQYQIMSEDARMQWDREWQEAMNDYKLALGIFQQMPLPQQISAFKGKTGGGNLGWSFRGY